MHTLKYKNQNINYSIIRKSTIKNLSIKIKYPDIVTVIAPPFVADDYIHNLVESKVIWISKKLLEYSLTKNCYKKLSFVTGDKILFLGDEYPLTVLRNKKYIKCELDFINNEFIAKVPLNRTINEQYDTLKKLLIEWYIKSGDKIAIDRIRPYCNILNLHPKSISVKVQKSSWGTCSSLGNIYINYLIFMAPLEVIDYVLVHELCHLKHMNHSKDYWQFVESIIPNYKNHKDWLKSNGPRISNLL